jgi:hypothetical protein
VAGAPKKTGVKPLRMSISGPLYDYLGWLTRNTLLGKSENDVATYLLTQRLEQMRQGNYHEEPLKEREG